MINYQCTEGSIIVQTKYFVGRLSCCVGTFNVSLNFKSCPVLFNLITSWVDLLKHQQQKKEKKMSLFKLIFIMFNSSNSKLN